MPLDTRTRSTVLVVGEDIDGFVAAVRRDDSNPLSPTKALGKPEWKQQRWASTLHGVHNDRALYQVHDFRDNHEMNHVAAVSKRFPAYSFYFAPSLMTSGRWSSRKLWLVRAGKDQTIVDEPNIVGNLADDIQMRCRPMGVMVSSMTGFQTPEPMCWDDGFINAWLEEAHLALERSLNDGKEPTLASMDWAPLMARARARFWRGAMEIATKMAALAQQLVLDQEDATTRNKPG